MTYKEEIETAERLCEMMGKIPPFERIEFFYQGRTRRGNLDSFNFLITRDGDVRKVEAWEKAGDLLISEKKYVQTKFYIIEGGAGK